MKQLLLSVLLFSACWASAQNGVTVSYKMESERGMNGTMQIFYSALGSRTEMHMNVPSMPGGMNKVMLVKKDEPQKVYNLDDQTKTYYEVELNESANSKTEAAAYTITVLGNEKIGSYACTHVQVSQAGGASYEMWTTKSITGYENYLQYQSGKYALNNGLQQALKAKGAEGFPVRIVNTEHRSKTTLELVSFTKATHAQSLFSIPADYTKGAAGGEMNNIQQMSPEERMKMMEKYRNGQH